MAAAVSMKSAVPPTSSAAAWAPSHADWLNDLSSTLPTSVTRPIDTLSSGSRAGQSTRRGGATGGGGAAAALGGRRATLGRRRAALGGRCAAALGGCCAGRRRRVAALIVVISATGRQHEPSNGEDRDELGRFHAPPQFVVGWVRRYYAADGDFGTSTLVNDGDGTHSPLGIRPGEPGRVRATMASCSPGQPAISRSPIAALVAVAREAGSHRRAEQAPPPGRPGGHPRSCRHDGDDLVVAGDVGTEADVAARASRIEHDQLERVTEVEVPDLVDRQAVELREPVRLVGQQGQDRRPVRGRRRPAGERQ